MNEKKKKKKQVCIMYHTHIDYRVKKKSSPPVCHVVVSNVQRQSIYTWYISAQPATPLNPK